MGGKTYSFTVTYFKKVIRAEENAQHEWVCAARRQYHKDP